MANASRKSSITATVRTRTTLFLFLFLFCSPSVAAAADFLTASQNLTDGDGGGGRTLISKFGLFELGFFSPENSTDRYLGIWFITTLPNPPVIWAANRRNPITDSSGVFKINATTGTLVLFQNHAVVWSAKWSKPVQTPKLQLLDTGNLVLKDAESDAISWQSFAQFC